MSKRRPPVYLRTMRLVDPRTGAEVSAMVPASAADAQQVRDQGLVIGQTIRAEITKPRNPGFHRLAHSLGELVRDNIEGFEGESAHKVIKRLQEESGCGCDVTRTEVPGMGVLISRRPKSIAFDSMDQGEFYEVMRGLCRHIARQYWPTCTPEEIESMVELMPGEVA